MRFLLFSRAWSRRLAVAWLLLMSVLFLLPGSAIPQHNFFSDLQFDKWVHIGLFATLLWLWAGAVAPLSRPVMVGMYVTAVLYGLGVEIAQDQLVANRSFDGWDLLADAAGAALGLWLFMRTYRKK